MPKIEDEDGKLRKLADAAIVLLVSRMSGPLLVGVCCWILHTVNDLQVNFATLNAGITATVSGINSDVGDLKNRLNSIEANYNGNGNIRYGFTKPN